MEPFRELGGFNEVSNEGLTPMPEKMGSKAKHIAKFISHVVSCCVTSI